MQNRSGNAAVGIIAGFGLIVIGIVVISLVVYTWIDTIDNLTFNNVVYSAFITILTISAIAGTVWRIKTP